MGGLFDYLGDLIHEGITFVVDQIYEWAWWLASWLLGKARDGIESIFGEITWLEDPTWIDPLTNSLAKLDTFLPIHEMVAVVVGIALLEATFVGVRMARGFVWSIVTFGAGGGG